MIAARIRRRRLIALVLLVLLAAASVSYTSGYTLHASAERVGVGLYSVDPFYARAPDRAGILLGFAPLTPADIREGIERLAAALK